VIPATTNPAGAKIKPAPILVHSINESMSTLADVPLFSLGFSLDGKLLNQEVIFCICSTLAHYHLVE
jgi:hypothetical protein